MESDYSGKTIKKGKGVQPPLFRLEKPKNEITNEKFISLFTNVNMQKRIFESSNEPTYIYWDRFKNKFPDDETSTTEEKWHFVRQLRDISSGETPIKSESLSYFKLVRLPSTDEKLHTIDMFTGGRLFNKTPLVSPTGRNTLLSRGIIEEAIASSQLEGAHTTRKAAKEFLFNKRAPSNESEQMILNNYKTINAIAEDFKNKSLTVDMLYELHSMLTENTIHVSEQHRLRKDSDEIIVQGQIGQDEYVTHVPPNEDFLKDAIKELIDYANDADGKFTHPIIKAITLHFWVGYLHPFTDGNGRLARALFYWYLLKKGYWTFMYLPISTIIKKAPMQYAMAYIYSEQDGFDVTYFYDFHIKKILQAVEEFEQYLDTKINENKNIGYLLEKKASLNERQKELVYYLVSEPNPSASISSHALLHNITRQTAATDLRELEAKKFIYSKRIGKYIKYFPSAKLLELTSHAK